MHLGNIDTVINELSNICKPIVEEIESQVPVTKDHYDQYMVAIEKVAEIMSRSERNKSVYLGIGVAFQRAGANKNGVQAALRIMGHL
jgi:hypothetical protein